MLTVNEVTEIFYLSNVFFNKFGITFKKNVLNPCSSDKLN